MQVEHPFQIPANINAVQNDQAAIPALGALHNLIRSLFVEDRSQIYWIFVMGMVAFVFLSTLINWILLIACLFKKRFTLLNLYQIPKCKFQIGFPNSTGFTVFTASASAIWFIIFAVHQFRLDQQLDPNELNSSMLWLCMLCLPFWFTFYVQSIEFMDLPLLKARPGTLMKNKVTEIILRCIFCIFAVALPFFAALISISSGYDYQQDYNDVVAETMLYFTDSDLSQDGFQLTGSPAGATKVLRRYEEEAVSIWKSLADIFYNAEGIMIGWACSFGLILVFYLVGAIKLYLAHRRSKKTTPNTTTNTTIKTNQDVEAIEFDSATLVDENNKTEYPDYRFMQKYKHTLSVMCCIVFLIINSFLADRLSHLVEMAQITQFIGHYLGILSMMALFASAYSVTHLSIIYANEFQSSSDPAVSIPVNQSKNDTETGSVDTDATLTA